MVVGCLLTHGAYAVKRNVLFIGNSYTYTNNMPLMVQTLATAMGDTLNYDESAIGGYTLQMHCGYAPTLAKIASQKWDVVILQEQSELPAFPPAQVDTAVLPYAHMLDSMIHANDSCTQTMFLMTWGHANGDPPNCDSYTVICNYEGMQERLRESYMLMTQDNQAIVAPVGMAWKTIMDSFPSLWLYIPDSSHPNIDGSYLETCVVYSSLFHQPVSGCGYTAGITAADAAILQSVSDKTVFDSLAVWQQWGHYPSAWLTTGCTNDTSHFSINTGIAAHYVFQFGDGAVVEDTLVQVSHVYATSGTYAVTVSASDSCFTEARNYVVACGGAAGVASVAAFGMGKVVAANAGAGRVVVLLDGIPELSDLEIDNGVGAKVATYGGVKNGFSVVLPPGFYILKARDAATGEMHVAKFVAY